MPKVTSFLSHCTQVIDMSDTVVEQLSLAPDTPPQGKTVTIPLDDLPPSDSAVFLGSHPDAGLRDSIKRFGVLQPILLVDDGLNALRVEEGRRRILAAREAGHTEIPATILVLDAWNEPGVLGLVANEHRSDNLYHALIAVRKLLNEGYTRESIGQTLGIRQRRLETILRLTNLHAVFADAFGRGFIKRGVAEEIARLDTDRQRRLLAVFEETGKITSADIREVKQARQAAAAASLSFLEEGVSRDDIGDEPEPERRRDSGISRCRASLISFMRDSHEENTWQKTRSETREKPDQTDTMLARLQRLLESVLDVIDFADGTVVELMKQARVTASDAAESHLATHVDIIKEKAEIAAGLALGALAVMEAWQKV